MEKKNYKKLYIAVATFVVLVFALILFLQSSIADKTPEVTAVPDNEFSREIANEILTEAGLEIDTAANGENAVAVIRKKGVDYYDFVLMDIQMPVMNGYEATAAIRQLPDGKRLPIIALSANAFAEDKEASLSAGMDDHVAKPINIKELFGCLAKFI